MKIRNDKGTIMVRKQQRRPRTKNQELRTKDDIAIKLVNVSKKYEIHHEKPTLVEKFVKGRNETFWALNNINFTIRKGERVGITGPNGSGKTTLLKVIAGITSPTSGTIRSRGRIVSLIDLDAGFHPDLSGVQNIYLNGSLLGMHRDEIDRKFEEIITFADIKQFIDAPLFTYSQGMVFRLSFSIGIYADPDILILDENIAVGDQEFQKKSVGSLYKYFNKQRTVIFVSHWMELLKKNCDRIMYLENGKFVQ